MLSLNSLTYKLLVALSALVLSSNLFLSVSRAPNIASLSIIGVRDLTLVLLCITLPIIFYLTKRKPILWLLVLFFWMVTGIVLFQSVFFDTAASITQTIALFRVVFALPILVISCCFICDFNNLKSSDKKWTSILEGFTKLFVFICLVEAFMLIFGLYNTYLELINYHAFMQSKGVSAGIDFGILDKRLITPLFNPSVGGVVLAAFFGFFLHRKQYWWAAICIAPLLLTVSKTGWIIAVIFAAFRRFNPVTGFILGIFAYISLAVLLLDLDQLEALNLNRDIFLHLASIDSHVNGLSSGLRHFFSPVGLGNAGTIPGVVFSEKLGRESGVGTGLATIGYAYLFLVSIAFFVLCSQYKRVGYLLASIYLLVALMNEGAATYYVWLPVFLLYLSSYDSK